ncbi:MAG: 3-oxoacyl-[Thermoguttaceae bacterium]|nr:3-oxoacyl-[acyl-carrier-protein] reductase [Thermoguttaceae bacterium]MBQ1864745.1 3-oxoacyl-[acyl-carrier-protein] reductase [Thermoguttaceae bacterium]MBQ2038884.1 3-oxoacyl-[acyl-carrier-protein] reductase [Thermoguttaceae bacterium]MBQ3821778.1 3-oxoacyl-[acyl-carrier-protein] reductase [Thermoguttaceae bacterium]MBQ4081638.1 3-oxoacyl-[acyl-carrier-protein] reductase [Thermoguttaceae bacterium]
MLQVDLTGKNAVVTGATRGIGFGIAKALAKSGASVACIGTNEEKLNASVAEIVADGGSAKAYICNVADSEAVAKTAETIIADFNKKVDILVNNAGITRDMLMRRITDEQWNDVISVNLNGTFYVTRAFVEQMRRGKWGRIINISSISGLIGNKGQANYSASKAGVIGFTRTISKELANRNITANAICPGFIDTDMTAVLDEAYKQVILSNIPAGRMGTPEDIANAVLFFASPDSSFVTGQILTVDGGMIF